MKNVVDFYYVTQPFCHKKFMGAWSEKVWELLL